MKMKLSLACVLTLLATPAYAICMFGDTRPECPQVNDNKDPGGSGSVSGSEGGSFIGGSSTVSPGNNENENDGGGTPGDDEVPE